MAKWALLMVVFQLPTSPVPYLPSPLPPQSPTSSVTYLLWLSLAGLLTVQGSMDFCPQTSRFQLYFLFLLHYFNYILYKTMKYHEMRVLFFL